MDPLAALPKPPAKSLLRRRPALLAALGLTLGCGGGSGGEGGPFATEGFPEGAAVLAGVALDAETGHPLMGLPVVITPSEGLPIERELESGMQAVVRTDRRGEFTFGGIGAGEYVLFVRFDSDRRGYGEVVGRVQAARVSGNLRLLPARVGLSFIHPRAGGIVAARDTAVVGFRGFRIDRLLTLAPESRSLFAAVEVYEGSGRGSGSGEGAAPPQPRRFEAAVGEDALEAGRAQVPIEVGGLGDPLRLESSLALHVVYRDPGGGPPAVHAIRGEAVQATSP